MADVANVNGNHVTNEIDSEVIPSTSNCKRGKTSKIEFKERKRQKRNEIAEATVFDSNLQIPAQPDLMAAENEGAETIEFKEDGEMIQMEINDGGAAAAEFASEEDIETETDSGGGSDSEPEAGEITSNSDQQASESEEEKINESVKTPSKEDKQAKRKAKDDRHRLSVEQRLNDMSDTLLFMKEMFLKNGLAKQNNPQESKEIGGKSTKKGNAQVQSNESNSETTIYHSALVNLKEQWVKGDVIQDSDDPEIEFNTQKKKKASGNKPPQRDSSSSDERIDTSDELLEMEMDVDINERFIADCEKSARDATESQ